MKKAGTILLNTVLLLSTLMGTASAAKIDVSVQVNKNVVRFPDAKPYYEAHRVMIPIRFVSEALGAEISYNTDRVVTIKQGDKTVVMKINSKTVTVDSVIKELDVPARLEQDRTYVPLRFVSEALGATVGWNQEQKLVSITTGSAATPTPTPEANSNNMYKVGFEWPRERELGKALFVDNMKVSNGKLTFTLPENASADYNGPVGGKSYTLEPGKSYTFTIGKDAGLLSISKPESKGDSWEAYYIMLDTSGNNDLKELFGGVKNDAIVIGKDNGGSPLSDVIQMTQQLK